MSKLCICALCKGRIFLISISSACCNSWTEHGRVIDIYRSSFSEMEGCGTRPESIIHRDFHLLAVVTVDAGEDGDWEIVQASVYIIVVARIAEELAPMKSSVAALNESNWWECSMGTGLGKVLETCLDSFFTLSGKVNLEFGNRFVAKDLLKTTRRKIGVLVYDGLSSIVRVNPVGLTRSFRSWIMT